MTYALWNNLFKSIARSCTYFEFEKPEGNTIRASYNQLNDEMELSANIVNSGHYPCLTHTSYSKSMPKNGNAASYIVTSNTLLILESINNIVGNIKPQQIQACYDRCEFIAMQIAAQLTAFFEDNPCMGSITEKGFELLEGSMPEHELYGWTLSFTVRNTANLSIDEAIWTTPISTTA